MRELAYLAATTIDGLIAADSSADPDLSASDGPQAPDLPAELPEIIPAHGRDLIGMPRDTPNTRLGTILMGLKTYGAGPKPPSRARTRTCGKSPISPPLGSAPHPAAEAIPSGAVKRDRAPKPEDGAGIWLCAGGTLAAPLAGETDELILKISPAAPGGGAPLPGGAAGPRRLAMTSHHVYGNGSALPRYRLADA